MVEADSLELVLYWATIPFYVIGFIGNVLVIRIVHKTREMHTPANYLLANIAVSDVITISLWPMYFFGSGVLVCKFVVLIEISIIVSSTSLTVLAVERYHALLKPFRTGLQLREDNIKQAIAFIWIASVILCFPEFILKEWSETHSACYWSMDFTHESVSQRLCDLKCCVEYLYSNGRHVLLLWILD